LFTAKPRGQSAGIGLTIDRRMLEGMGGMLELAQCPSADRSDASTSLLA
jgi:C4-dicarboxylate-specific signal transduction histidine kinase